MATHSPRRVIGIDLGTTNTVIATSLAESHATRLGNGAGGATTDGRVAVVPILQHTDAGEVERLSHLPSVLYHALPEERFDEFTPNRPWVVGQHARRRAAETAERVITSAKSWLCHNGVDRTAAILPWVSRSDDNDERSLPRLSPVEVSAAILRHAVMALAEAGHTATEADVVLTVPASFDQVARQLTVESATRAGLSVRLLEEPQAAFYDWIHRASHQDVEALLENRDGFTVLVIDVGGGTTDLTLLRVTARGQLSETERLTLPPTELVAVERIAVGRHLLLGGDNIDLALAHLVERKLEAPKRLAASEFAQLVAMCQNAKERLLGPNPPSKVPIRLARRGSALFGNVLGSDLTRAEVQQLVFSGFLPDDDQNTPPKRGRSGLLAFGLPFESDPAITHHVGQFLTQHHARVDGILFNGGLFKSETVAQHLTKVVSRWMGKPVLALPHIAPDEAVARGAVHYGLALQGKGVKFTGGSARGYYIAVDAKAGTRKAVCVVPKGATEDELQRVEGLPLRLTVGKTVKFELHSNAVEQHQVGEVVELATSNFEPVATVATRLATQAAEGVTKRPQSPPATSDMVSVVLQGCLTPVGTLELGCQQVEPPQRRFELVFEVRAGGASEAVERDAALESAGVARGPAAAPRVGASGEGRQQSSFSLAEEMFHRVFGKGRKDVHGREVKDLWRDLEKELGPRQAWEISLTRNLCDVLLPLASGRRRTVDHERHFFALAGYLLRPGFGYPGDAERVAALEPLFEPGLLFHTERTNWDQFYIAWRRVAAGMTEPAQELARNVLDPFVAPADLKLKKSKVFKTPEIPALWDLLSWLERVAPERRAALGQWLLDRTWTSRDPKNWEWLGRVGGREPVYASAHHVVRPRHAEAWLEHLLSESWDAMPSAPFAAVQLARRTNDRARDVNAAIRERVLARLAAAGASEIWLECVAHHVPNGPGGANPSFGEELPPGLLLD